MTDTGPGIPEQKQARIFDDQVDLPCGLSTYISTIYLALQNMRTRSTSSRLVRHTGNHLFDLLSSVLPAPVAHDRPQGRKS